MLCLRAWRGGAGAIGSRVAQAPNGPRTYGLELMHVDAKIYVATRHQVKYLSHTICFWSPRTHLWTLLQTPALQRRVWHNRRNEKQAALFRRISTHASARSVHSGRVATTTLNKELRNLLKTKTTSYENVLRTLREAPENTQFNIWTHEYVLRCLQKMPDATPRQKVALGLRMIQRARADGVPLDEFSLMYVLPLLARFRKTNLIFALKNEIERHTEQPLDEPAFYDLIRYFETVYEHELMQKMFREMLFAHQEADVQLFWDFLIEYEKKKNELAQLLLWQVLFDAPFCYFMPLEEIHLEYGTYLALEGPDKGGHAKGMSTLYERLQITPSPIILRVLTKASLNAGDFKEARAFFRRMTELGYVIQKPRLYNYLIECAARGQQEELVPLAYVLVEVKGLLCETYLNHSEFLRAYIQCICDAAYDDKIETRLAHRIVSLVMRRWPSKDKYNKVNREILMELAKTERLCEEPVVKD